MGCSPSSAFAASRSRCAAISKQRRPVGGRDRQPACLAAMLPACLVGAADRAVIDRGGHLDIGVLQRVGGLLDQRALTDAALIFRAHRSPSRRATSRRDTLAAVSVAAAAATAGPNAPAGTPAGSSASVHLAHVQRTRIRRCSLTTVRTTISLTWWRTSSPSQTPSTSAIGAPQPAHPSGQAQRCDRPLRRAHDGCRDDRTGRPACARTASWDAPYALGASPLEDVSELLRELRPAWRSSSSTRATSSSIRAACTVISAPTATRPLSYTRSISSRRTTTRSPATQRNPGLLTLPWVG
jgi:hypothetical protein